MLNPKILLLVALLGSVATVQNVSARGRKFSCPLPNGVTCMSVEDVYSATNHANSLTTDAVHSIEAHQPPAPPPPPVPVVGQPVMTPVRCCEPVKTNVMVVGDTLAVSSPGPGMTGYGTPRTYQATVSPMVTTSVTPLATSAPHGEALREQAHVMRIYITPWEDETGDLHLGGYVLTEVEPRRWSVGVRAPSDSDAFHLVTQSSVRETAQEASTSKAHATPEDVRTGSEVAASTSLN